MTKTITEKNIYGRKVRTNNQNPDEILNLWEAFSRLNVQGDVYAVYSNYASDFTGDYDLHIGTEENVTNESNVKIPAGNYYVIDVDPTIENAVFNAWVEIWGSELQRAYTTDFEFYGTDGRVQIYLSMK
ncbi:GyrI-like domain-containing protein [Solibacillus sp. FSL K6-1523]|uniref:GyrI-like domain-containing protein n=1 Tax=Solibacillus sp. FSL K6-1523 TaxID=2921471 RepID=UPI0030F513E6